MGTLQGRIFVIADLHLSFASEKPMDIFGGKWRDHADRIAENWRACVTDRDIVVVPGDLSWAMKQQDAIPDLAYIDSLPGRKILMKGNHEFWWTSAEKLRQIKETNHFSSLFFLQNNAFYVADADVIICGSRGWKCPGEEGDFDKNDTKIYLREQMRISRSIAFGKALRSRYMAAPSDDMAGVFFLSENADSAADLQDRAEAELLLFLHYPPFNNHREPSGFTELIENERISACYFGHLHGMGTARKNAEGNLLPVYRRNDVKYYLTSSDFLDFCPVPVWPV